MEFGKVIQRTRGEHCRNTNLLLKTHLHVPDTGDGHQYQHCIRKDIAEAVYVLHIVALGITVGLWIRSKLEVPGSCNGPTGEDGQQYGDSRPDGQDGTCDPGCDAEAFIYVEYPVEEEKEGYFG